MSLRSPSSPCSKKGIYILLNYITRYLCPLVLRSSRNLDDNDEGKDATVSLEVAQGSGGDSGRGALSAAGLSGWHERFERERLQARAEQHPARYHTHGNPAGAWVALECCLPWQKLTGALVIRAALSQASPEDNTSGDDTPLHLAPSLPSPPSPPVPLSSLPSYGLLLTLLPGSQQEDRLCPLREATATLRALLSDSPGNQEAAVKAQVISAMVHVSCARSRVPMGEGGLRGGG